MIRILGGALLLVLTIATRRARTTRSSWTSRPRRPRVRSSATRPSIDRYDERFTGTAYLRVAELDAPASAGAHHDHRRSPRPDHTGHTEHVDERTR